MKQSLVIPNWLPAQLANGNLNWRVRQERLQAAKTMAWASAKHAGWQRIDGRARLTITLVFGTNRRRDIDNLYARVKGLVDGLKDYYVDDDYDHLDLRVRVAVLPGCKEVRMEFEALDDSVSNRHPA